MKFEDEIYYYILINADIEDNIWISLRELSKHYKMFPKQLDNYINILKSRKLIVEEKYKNDYYYIPGEPSIDWNKSDLEFVINCCENYYG
jgi:predicted transcriptional regulator